MCVFCMQAFSIKDNTNFKPQLEIIEKAVEVPAIAWGETFLLVLYFCPLHWLFGAGRQITLYRIGRDWIIDGKSLLE